jgi:hypothetical protein
LGTIKTSVTASALLLAGALPAPLYAADDDVGGWLIVCATDHFSPAADGGRWRYWFDGQYRRFERAGGINQYVLRPALGFDLADNASAWLGYAYVTTSNTSGARIDEHRVWQQLSWNTAKWGETRLSLRTRVEERWRDAGADTAVTLRQQVKLVSPFPGVRNADLVLIAEPFFDFRDTDWGAQSGLRQLRSSIGIGFALSQGIRLETGYLNQYAPRSNQSDIANHLAYFQFRFDL